MQSVSRRTAVTVILVMLGLTAVIVAFFSSYSSALGKPAPHQVPVAVVAFFSSYSSALGKPAPHQVPVAVVASRAALPELDGQLRVYSVPDLARARSMIEDRTVYGALALPASGPATLLVASGGGHAVAALLTQLGQQEARAHGTTLSTADIAPASPNDPNGTVEFYCIVFLGIGGAVGGTVLGRVLGPVRRLPDALKRLGAVVAYAALLGVVVTLFADIVYGALVGHFGLLFLTLWLYVAAVCLAVMGLGALAGPLASFVLIGALIIFGNTSAGGAVPQPLLNGFYAALSLLLPQGAALSALRGVQYFGDHGLGPALLCLAIWAVAGLGLLGAAALRDTRPRKPQVNAGIPAAVTP